MVSFISDDAQLAYAKAHFNAKAMKKLGLKVEPVAPPSVKLMTAKKWKAAQAASAPQSIGVSTNFVGSPADVSVLVDPSMTKQAVVEAKSGLSPRASLTSLQDQANALVAQLTSGQAEGPVYGPEVPPELQESDSKKWIWIAGAGLALLLLLRK